MLEASRRSAHGVGQRLGAGMALVVIVILSLELGWSIWTAVLSLATAVLKSIG
jgi:hypothetical protein